MTAKEDLAAKVQSLGNWYHRIDLGNGVITPGDRNQALTFNLYKSHLPADLTGKRVLDLGANACGLSIEFAKRGADVVAVEYSVTYVKQAEFILDHFGLADRVKVVRCDLFDVLDLGQFDIVAYVGLFYHIRYPQLSLDMLSSVCTDKLLVSTQTIPGDGLQMVNRARSTKDRKPGELYGWEPTETLFADMVAHAGFKNVKLLSTAPHAGEEKGNILGNRSYYIADAGAVTKVPFANKISSKSQLAYTR